MASRKNVTPVVLVKPNGDDYDIAGTVGPLNYQNITPVVLVKPNGVEYEAGTGGGSGSGVTTGSESVALGDSVVVITHGLGNINAVLVAAFPDWFGGMPRIIDQDANTITIEYPQENPNDPGTVKFGVVEP